jgi:two-component system, NtrC family, sensor kinase
VTEWLPRLVARIPATVHAKLLVAFLAIAVLLIVLGAVGLEVLSGVNRRAEDLVKLQEKIAAYRQLQRDTSLPSSWSWNERTLEAARVQLNQFRHDFDRLPSVSAEEAAALAHARGDYDRFMAALDQLSELTQAGKADAARELLLAQGNPLAERLERLTNGFVNNAEVDMASRMSASQDAYVTSRWVVIGFAIGSIGLALLLGYAISWSLVRPVTLMDARLRLVAAGDFSQRVEVANRDELGGLAAQFNRMSAQLDDSYATLTERTHQLTESLEHQTATSEVLRVFSNSPTDVRPVFEAIVANGARLCGGQQCVLFGFDGAVQAILATHNYDPEGDAALRAAFPRPAGRESTSGRAILERRVAHIPDIAQDPEYGLKEVASMAKYHAVLSVPLMREGRPIGALSVGRQTAGPFSDRQIDLLQTFADQAVVAIENIHLFTELEEKNQALTKAHAQVTEALDQQTATAEILRVISNSPTDLQPVFDTIVESVVRLCGGVSAFVYRFDGELIHLSAHHHTVTSHARDVFERRYPRPPSRESMIAQAILDRTIVHVPDFEADTDAAPASREMARAASHRSTLAVPMLRHGSPIGAVAVGRRGPNGEPRPFSGAEIELLQTFADQAVIAIENVRLFTELQSRTEELTRSVERLTALGEVGRAVSSTLDIDTVLNTIVSRASQLAVADGGAIYEYDEETDQFHVRATYNFDEDVVEASRAMPLRKGEGLMGRAAELHEALQTPDIAVPGAYQSQLRDVLITAGYRALLSVPLLREEQVIGNLTLARKAPGAFPGELVELLKTFATQSALALQNARLFREIADKSRQLEVASRHKSEFLANMSHELRTPLNAIIGFSEVLSERMFGELNDKQAEYLRDIYASGQHLLSLINDILDLSKIEAGRMELELTDFSLPAAIDNALTLVRERAARRGIALRMTADERVGEVRGDERKIRQVVLNLLSNAIKFTPEGGRIEVGATMVDAAVEVSVRDTGVGIAPEDQQAVFEEFRQVGASAAKQEGTGLGLALCRKFIELHGGTIWVTSAVGAGSTFTFRLPAR